MSSVDYTSMSYSELRRYFLTHRDDRAAFQAYLTKRRERSRPVITSISDPNFDARIQASIEKQIAEFQGHQKF